MNVQLLGWEFVADETKLFRFTKPAGFEYRAGQSVDLTLPTGAMHPYSLVSAPHESELAIATRMRPSAFKKELGALQEGAEVTIEGPFGSFFLHENVTRPAVFIAGGIGITPFYSMVKDATNRALLHEMHLFYSNHRPEDAAFLTELRALENENQRFAFVPTMTKPEASSEPWTGEHGYVTAEMIKKYVRATNPMYYCAGPAPMVTAMRMLLKTIGVSEDDIRFEEFTGY